MFGEAAFCEVPFADLPGSASAAAGGRLAYWLVSPTLLAGWSITINPQASWLVSATPLAAWEVQPAPLAGWEIDPSTAYWN